MMPLELVVFDLAGTTVKDNKDVHRMLQASMMLHGVTISLDDANLVMGIPKPIAIRRLLERRYLGPRAISEEWINEIHGHFVRNMMSFYQFDPGVGEKEGVGETFRRLKENKMKVFVDTGFDRQITRPLLERLGWEKDELIDGSVTSDEVDRGRPYPDLIYKAMHLANISDPNNVVKVGDTISDVEEGKAAGCRYVIGITTGAFSHEALETAQPTHLIKNVSELLKILDM